VVFRSGLGDIALAPSTDQRRTSFRARSSSVSFGRASIHCCITVQVFGDGLVCLPSFGAQCLLPDVSFKHGVVVMAEMGRQPCHWPSRFATARYTSGLRRSYSSTISIRAVER